MSFVADGAPWIWKRLDWVIAQAKLDSTRVAEVLETAQLIWQTERGQAHRIRAGESLRQQTSFDDYLASRAADPSSTFRKHRPRTGGAVGA